MRNECFQTTIINSNSTQLINRVKDNLTWFLLRHLSYLDYINNDADLYTENKIIKSSSIDLKLNKYF